jgi:hypothetical protein
VAPSPATARSTPSSKLDGFTGVRQSVSPDIIDAAARAYVPALSVAETRSRAGSEAGLPAVAQG